MRKKMNDISIHKRSSFYSIEGKGLEKNSLPSTAKLIYFVSINSSSIVSFGRISIIFGDVSIDG